MGTGDTEAGPDAAESSDATPDWKTVSRGVAVDGGEYTWQGSNLQPSVP